MWRSPKNGISIVLPGFSIGYKYITSTRALVGAGNMGSPMARNLLRAGHQVAVYNRTRAHAEPLLQEGAALAESPADAARDADAIITMLADDHAVEQAVQGFLDTLAPGAMHIGM